jgi:hypothetical protein
VGVCPRPTPNYTRVPGSSLLDFDAPDRATRRAADRVESTLRRLHVVTMATAVLGAITLTIAVVAIFALLRSSAGQADLLNRLGRQRMLLQRIGVAELAIDRATTATDRERWARIARDAVNSAGADWNALRYDPALPPFIGSTLDDISPIYQAAVSMGRVATTRTERDSTSDLAVAEYLRRQQDALSAVDSTMKRYVAFEDDRLSRARLITTVVAFIALLLLAFGTFGNTLPLIASLRRDAATLLSAHDVESADPVAPRGSARRTA